MTASASATRGIWCVIAGWLAVSVGCGGSANGVGASSSGAPANGGGVVGTSSGGSSASPGGAPTGTGGAGTGTTPGTATSGGSPGAASGVGGSGAPAASGGTGGGGAGGAAGGGGGGGGGGSPSGGACAALVPAPGADVEVILSTGTHSSCAMAMTSPGGEVALGVQGGSFGTQVTFHLYAPSGAPRNVDLPLLILDSRDDIDPWFHWTSSGWAGLVHDVPPPVGLRTWSASGAVLATTQDYAVSSAPDGHGGTVALLRRVDPGTAPLGPTRLEWLDASGAMVRTADPAGDPTMVLVSWGSGHVLLISPGPDRAQARWIDDAGAPLTPWFDAGTTFDPQLDASMHLLVDGSIVLRAGDTWRALFRDGVPAADPVPGWLAARPGTRLATIRQGAAYAVLPSVQPTAGANQAQLEIVTVAGESCGTVTLPPPVGVPGATKSATRLDVGQDGTVLQTELLTGPDLGMGIHCGFRWWPALVR